ncbi:MAG TPA: glutaminyl-peptide cyclotransferase [Bacteroidales bacterium]|nr:glutaminyl-peptide cyclotransferase [Bacteroidales bacterium]
MKFYVLILAVLLSVFFSRGCDRKVTKSTKSSSTNAAVQKLSRVTTPGQNKKIVPGESVAVGYEYPDSMEVDSVEVFLRGAKRGVFVDGDEVQIETDGLNPGAAGLRVRIHFSEHKPESHSRRLTVLSDIVPETYFYRVVNTYPHDVGAYTQGLIYYDGWLYEGTGNIGESTVRKVRLTDGEIVQMRNNSSDIFGEGITVFNGKIYQLTYKAQICYVYELNSLEEVQRHYYQNKEGWGLTNNETELIMSDGSNIIYFIDPEMFTVKRQIEVYNHEGPVRDLNELELINGKIYANRYYTDEIVIIDPETGKEEGRVNLKGILPVEERTSRTNVLNGIAWDAEGNRLFVTGKYWPRLYEIRLYQ